MVLDLEVFSMVRYLLALPALLVVLLLGAAPNQSSDALLREGDAAYAQGNFEKALALYEQAEERSTNPGRVAAHQAAALVHLGQYPQAEERYRCALEDATGPRRAALLFDHGNCLLRLASEPKVGNSTRLRSYAEAVAHYREALSLPGTAPALTEDTRHNLELALLLWGQARQQAPRSSPSEEPLPNETPPEPPRSPTGPSEEGTREPAGSRVGTRSGTEERPTPGDQSQPRPTNEPGAPGKGRIRPLPDSTTAQPVSPDDAARHLEEAAARIRERRRANAQAQVIASPAGRIW